MTSVTVAIVGSTEVAPALGKRSAPSDLTLYHAVREGHALTLVEPTQFPEKLAPLLVALAMADRTLLAVPSLTRDVAEAAAAADLYETPVDLLLGPTVGEEEVRRALRGTRLATAPSHPIDLPALRAMLDGWAAPAVDGPPEVVIDHAFPVKGVGAVALGIVRRGTVQAHERFRLYPTEKEVEIRSIQVHDVDVRSATSGDRVGLAIKGVDADELGRGQTLAPEGSLSVGTRFAARIARRCPYYRGRLSEGLAGHLLVGLQYVPASVEAVDGDRLTLEADRPVAYAPGGGGILADLSASPGPRVVSRLGGLGPSQA